MTEKTTAARPDTRAAPFAYSENGKVPPWYGPPNPNICSDSELNTPQADGRGKAMDKGFAELKSKFNGCQNKVDSVAGKLELLNGLFYMFWLIKKR
jgi:hypothetical protein